MDKPKVERVGEGAYFVREYGSSQTLLSTDSRALNTQTIVSDDSERKTLMELPSQNGHKPD